MSSVSQVPTSAFHLFANQIRKNIDRWLLPAILLLALALRLFMLSDKSFWADELDQILYGKGDLAFTLGSSTPPLDYIITHLVVHYIGQSEFIVRLPDVVWGVLTVLVVYQLGRYLFDQPTAYLAAFLLAITPIHIQYSQEARYYSLPTLLFLLCAYTCVRAIDQQSWWRWLSYSFVCLAALFTHVYTAPLLALLGLWVLFIKRPSWRVLLAFVFTSGIPTVLFVLWFVSKRDVYLYSRNLYTPPIFLKVIPSPFVDISLIYKIFTAHPDIGSGEQVLTSALITTLLIVIIYWSLLMAAVFLILQHRVPAAFRSVLSLLIIVAFGGMGASLVIDYITQYFFDPRQFVFFTPMVCLIVAATYLYLVRTSNFRIIKRTPRSQLISRAILIMVIISLLVFWTPIVNVYQAPTQNWRDLAQDLVRTMGPNDTLISPFTEYLGIYQPSLLTRTPPGMLEDVTGLWSRGYPNMPPDVATVSAIAQTHERLWIVLLQGSSYEHPPALVDWIDANHLQPKMYGQDIEVYTYSASKSG